MMSHERAAMNLDLNSPDRQRSRAMSLSDLAFDELISPVSKSSSGNFRSVTSSAMTPTPTQFLFPTSVTAEQEAYASGFARALEEIYRSEGQCTSQPKMVASIDRIPTATSSSQLTTVNSVARLSTFMQPPPYSVATTGMCPNVLWPGSKATDSVRSTPSHVQHAKNYVSYLPAADSFDNSLVTYPANAATPRTLTAFPPETSALGEDCCDQHPNWHTMVPVCATSSMSTAAVNHSSLSAAADSTVSGPSTKLDMDEQEEWRLERKRAKNRVAAARCQMRKVERITRLQEKVQELRSNNARLVQTVVELKSHVSTLRKQILMHTERGCRMMIPALS